MAEADPERTVGADLVALLAGEPESAVGAGGDPVLPARRVVDLGDDPRGGDPADLAGCRLGVPERAVGAGGDPVRLAGRGEGELVERAPEGDPADPIRPLLGEPEVRILPHGDLGRLARGIECELGNGPIGCDPANATGPLLGEPEGAVGSGGDPVGLATGREGEFRDVPFDRDSTDLVEPLLGEPEAPSGLAVMIVGDAPEDSGNSWIDASRCLFSSLSTLHSRRGTGRRLRALRRFMVALSLIKGNRGRVYDRLVCVVGASPGWIAAGFAIVQQCPGRSSTPRRERPRTFR